jgi:hypothetical protein
VLIAAQRYGFLTCHLRHFHPALFLNLRLPEVPTSRLSILRVLPDFLCMSGWNPTDMWHEVGTSRQHGKKRRGARLKNAAAKGETQALKTHRQRPEILIGTDGVLRSEPPNGPWPQASEVGEASSNPEDSLRKQQGSVNCACRSPLYIGGIYLYII